MDSTSQTFTTTRVQILVQVRPHMPTNSIGKAFSDILDTSTEQCKKIDRKSGVEEMKKSDVSDESQGFM